MLEDAPAVHALRADERATNARQSPIGSPFNNIEPSIPVSIPASTPAIGNQVGGIKQQY